MTKLEFLNGLRQGLSDLPLRDKEDRISFYSEMIDDRIEDGASESDAVDSIGSVESVTEQILSQSPIATLVKERVSKKGRIGTAALILIIAGSPIWLSLLIAGAAVVIATFAALWSMGIALWSVAAALAACTLAGIASSSVLIFSGNVPAAVFMIGGGIFCFGLSVFMFFACKAATKGLAVLTAKTAVGIATLFVKRRSAQR